MTFLKFVSMTGGVALIVLGIVIAPLPGPFGLPVAIAGLIVLLRSSMWARRHFMHMVRVYPNVLRPVRALLRPGAKIIALMWLNALRLERRFVPGRHHCLYGCRHGLKTLTGHRHGDAGSAPRRRKSAGHARADSSRRNVENRCLAREGGAGFP